MLGLSHPLPMRQLTTPAQNFINIAAGATYTSPFWMVQGYSHITGAIEFASGGNLNCAFTMFQGYQDNTSFATTFMRWIHNKHVLTINNGALSNQDFKYIIFLKGMYFTFVNTSGDDGTIRISIFLRNE